MSDTAAAVTHKALMLGRHVWPGNTRLCQVDICTKNTAFLLASCEL